MSRSTASAIALAVALLVVVACGDPTPYYCGGNEDCIDGTRAGTCVLDYEVCAFPDPTCTSAPNLRFDESAAEVANLCVGDEP